MEPRFIINEIQFWDGIIEFITPIDLIKQISMPDEFEYSPFVSEERLERLKTLFESVVDLEDYKYERRRELFNKFITRIKINRRLRIEWKELKKEINIEFYKMRCRQETAQKQKKRQRQRQKEAKKKRNQSAEHFRQRVFTSSKINRREEVEEVEEQEEVDLTDMEEYDLTGPGEPVYETPIMTPQLTRRIMANEFSQDQVEYIIKKALKN